MHENVTYKYVEVNPTGMKGIRRQTPEGSQAFFPSGGGKSNPGGHVSSQSDRSLMEEGRTFICMYIVKMYQ